MEDTDFLNKLKKELESERKDKKALYKMVDDVSGGKRVAERLEKLNASGDRLSKDLKKLTKDAKSTTGKVTNVVLKKLEPRLQEFEAHIDKNQKSFEARAKKSQKEFEDRNKEFDELRKRSRRGIRRLEDKLAELEKSETEQAERIEKEAKSLIRKTSRKLSNGVEKAEDHIKDLEDKSRKHLEGLEKELDAIRKDFKDRQRATISTINGYIDRESHAFEKNKSEGIKELKRVQKHNLKELEKEIGGLKKFVAEELVDMKGEVESSTHKGANSIAAIRKAQTAAECKHDAALAILKDKIEKDLDTLEEKAAKYISQFDERLSKMNIALSKAKKSPESKIDSAKKAIEHKLDLKVRSAKSELRKEITDLKKTSGERSDAVRDRMSTLEKKIEKQNKKIRELEKKL